ncbi:hypothetical protein FWH13_00075 [Candidatus Saccharibacteria bacterium]|nr:hypothetical protein [Candidatus Saccharibacteria bacterium]
MSFELARQEEPLFPEVEFSRPERKMGKVAVIGGSGAGVAAESRAYERALLLGAEEVQAILPGDGQYFKMADKEAIAAAFAWADGVLLLGDLGRNAETAQVLSTVLEEAVADDSLPKRLLITRDAVDVLLAKLPDLLDRPEVMLVLTFSQLQKLFKEVLYPKVLVMSLPLPTLADILHKFTLSYNVCIATVFNQELLVASGGEVTATNLVITNYNPLTVWSGDLAVAGLMYWVWGNMSLKSVTAASILA